MNTNTNAPMDTEEFALVVAYIAAGVSRYLTQLHAKGESTSLGCGELEAMREIIGLARGKFDGIPEEVPLSDILYIVAEEYGIAAAQRLRAGNPLTEAWVAKHISEALAEVAAEWSEEE